VIYSREVSFLEQNTGMRKDSRVAAKGSVGKAECVTHLIDQDFTFLTQTSF
jgi:hypothetical protein